MQHARQAFLSFNTSRSLFKPMSTELVMLFNHLILFAPFSFCFQSFPASGSFPVGWLFSSGVQRIASASASVLPMTIQGCFPLGLTGLISLPSKGPSRVFSKPQFKSINSLALSLLYGPILTSVGNYLLVGFSYFLLPISERQHIPFKTCIISKINLEMLVVSEAFICLKEYFWKQVSETALLHSLYTWLALFTEGIIKKKDH